MTAAIRSRLRPAALALLLVSAALAAGCGADSPEVLSDKARESLARQDSRSAEIHLKNLLQQRPDDGEARALLASIHQANRDPRSAEKEWLRALELGVAPDRALPGLLESRIQIGDAGGALEATSRYAATQPTPRAATAYWRGRAHAELGQPTEAEAALHEALGLDPDLHPARVALIRQQASRGDLAGAATAVDALLAKAPALPEALLLRGDLQLARSDPAGARETFGKAIDADPTSIDARIRLVSLLTALADYPAAESMHAQLAKLAPGLPITTHLKAVLDFRQSRLDAARDGVQAVLKVMPDFLPAVSLAADVALRQHSLEQAETHARRLVSRAPDSVHGARLLSTVLLRRNDPEGALQIAKAALDRGVQDAALMGIAGEAALRRNDIAGATAYFERATRLDPRDASQRTGLGLAQLSAGRAEAGFADLQAAVELDPQGTRADFALISARIRTRQFDQALAAIDRLAGKQPDRPIAHYLRGTVLLARDERVQARASLERALATDPAFFPAAASLAELDQRDTGPAIARERLAAFVKANPRNVQAAVALAQFTGRAGGTPAEVERILRQAQVAVPGAVEPALTLARLQILDDRARDALPMLQQALAQHPADRALLDTLGTAFLRIDDTQQAIDAFERAVRLDPRSPAAHMRLAEVKASLGDRPGALASFRQAAQLDPKAPGPGFGMAALLLSEGRKDEAQRIASRMQEDMPKHPAGLALEGDLHAADGRWAEAAAAYRKAVAIERTTPLVIKHHQALLRAHRPTDADAALREALGAAPKDVPLRLYAGERAIASRHWKVAAQHYDVAVQVSPDNVVALNNLAWSLKELGDPRALEVAEDAHRRAPRAASVIDTLGMVLLETGDTQRGTALLRQAVEIAPKTPQYRLHYAQALVRSGDTAAARTELETLLKAFPTSTHAKSARDMAARL